MIKGPADRDGAVLLKLWAMLVKIPRDTPMPFIRTIEAKLGFECKMLEEAIIFFKSKYRWLGRGAKIIPIKGVDGTNEDKNREGEGEGGKIDLIIPNIPNFDDSPADNDGIGGLASRWTSGDQ